MTNDIQTMRKKICELGRLMFNQNLTDAAAYILLQIGVLSALVSKSPTLFERSALLKESAAKYGKSFE